MGHDVMAAAEDPTLASLNDPDLLTAATDQDRILITCNIRDFPGILRKWGREGRQYAGCLMLVGIDHGEFGVILRALDRMLQRHPDQVGWRDCPRFVSRADQ